jgi:hypothetical protein
MNNSDNRPDLQILEKEEDALIALDRLLDPSLHQILRGNEFERWLLISGLSNRATLNVLNEQGLVQVFAGVGDCAISVCRDKISPEIIALMKKVVAERQNKIVVSISGALRPDIEKAIAQVCDKHYKDGNSGSSLKAEAFRKDLLDAIMQVRGFEDRVAL